MRLKIGEQTWSHMGQAINNVIANLKSRSPFKTRTHTILVVLTRYFCSSRTIGWGVGKQNKD